MKRKLPAFGGAVFAVSYLLILAFGASAGVPAQVDSDRMRAAAKEPAQWMSFGRTYDEQRFSPLNQLNTQTVKKLGLAWYADLNTFRGVEATPLFVDGVLYNISAWNITTAYNAETGAVLWTYDPKVLPEAGRKACCDIVSRGLAVWKGKVIIATLDGRLIALNAANGKEIWTVNTFEGEGGWPYTITGAPRVFDGRVVIGNAGAELGVRGFVTAYDAETGKQLWRFYTVPGDPSKGFESKAMEMAAKTWTGEWWKFGGGGTAWDSIVYDQKLKLVYIGVGNGSPWVHKYRSPSGGDNLFLSSIVAVNAETGEYVWHYQETPGEQFDYTATQPMMLADLKIGGRLRQVIMQAPKNGFFYMLDRKTGELISATPFVKTTWATHVDMKTGRPVETPEARYGEKPVLLSPSPGGAHNFNPISYSPKTGLVYLSVSQNFGTFAADPNWDITKGGTGEAFSGYDELRQQQAKYADEHEKSWLSAWDPVKGREVWRVPYAQDGSGGTLATAGNLVFQGTINKTLAAYAADTGEKLWEGEAQSVPIAGPITYEMNGVQYVAVNAGWGGGRAHFQTNSFQKLQVASARLVVFKLGGKAKLPVMEAKDLAPPVPPLAMNVDPVLLARGGSLFAANCALCHGVAARGGIKDLRFMTPETHGQFLDIVIGGARQKAGMASFADKLTKEDAEAIHAYLIARANEDWGQQSH
ncbi:MAG: PQQ-dependent dehydrogenase, methanol/ethanol family [Steroidobacteraceae bacterium]